ncbi:MAG: sulfotransferase [Promethearchaeota archaeon]
MPKLTRKIIDASLPEKRLMDNVLMGADEPTEDEYCLGTYSKYAYYHGFVFPQKFKKLAKYHSFHDMPKDVRRWQKDYSKMVNILDYVYDGRQLILKNPAVCFKVKYILDMYPNAKFIFTYRNPSKYEDFLQTPMEHMENFTANLTLPIGTKRRRDSKPMLITKKHTR